MSKRVASRWRVGVLGASFLTIAVVAACTGVDVTTAADTTASSGTSITGVPATELATSCHRPQTTGSGHPYYGPDNLDELLGEVPVVVEAEIMAEGASVEDAGGFGAQTPLDVRVLTRLHGQVADRITVLRRETRYGVTGDEGRRLPGAWGSGAWPCPGERWLLVLQEWPEQGPGYHLDGWGSSARIAADGRLDQEHSALLSTWHAPPGPLGVVAMREAVRRSSARAGDGRVRLLHELDGEARAVTKILEAAPAPEFPVLPMPGGGGGGGGGQLVVQWAGSAGLVLRWVRADSSSVANAVATADDLRRVGTGTVWWAGPFADAGVNGSSAERTGEPSDRGTIWGLVAAGTSTVTITTWPVGSDPSGVGGPGTGAPVITTATPIRVPGTPAGLPDLALFVADVPGARFGAEVAVLSR